jgi:uncharacterized protein YbcI
VSIDHQEPMSDHISEPGDPGELVTTEGPAHLRISRGMTALWKQYYGRGPRHVRTYLMQDVVLVVMRGGFNKVEETLLDEGRGDAVEQQRAAFQRVMDDRFRSVIEDATGRTVQAFMSANHQAPDVMAEIFILEGPAPESGG